MRRKAFATLTAVAAMILLTAYLAIGTMNLSGSQGRLQTVSAQSRDQSQAWTVLSKGLDDLSKTWDPRAQTFSTWSKLHGQPGLQWESLSGKINLNTLSAFVIELSGFAATLKDVSPAEFTGRRAKMGLQSALGGYSELVRKEYLSSWYTVHSLWNLNTVDEVMLERMVSGRTGSETAGSALRAWVRGFRTQQKPILPSDWETQKAVLGNSMGTITTLEPELDVNEAPQALLRALMSNPAWNRADTDAKVSAIVTTRGTKPWTNDALKDLLQLPPGSPLIPYLGTSTRFVGGWVDEDTGSLEFVIYVGSATGAGVQPRILQSQWRRKG
jgi:hypothetical protein